MNYSRLNKRKKKKSVYKWTILSVLFIGLALGIAYYVTTEKKAAKEEPQVNEPKEVVDKQSEPQQSLEPVVSEPVEEIQIDEGGYAVTTSAVTEPTYIDGILIANKKYPLPQDFNPGEDPEALAAYKQMAVAALKAGYEIMAFSSFRSYEYQTTLYENYVVKDGKANADRYSARPGHSEHQTGLAFDIGEVGREDLWLTAEFGETPAGLWLVNNAHKYGFILRFPKGKEDVTGFMYESWHFRYLGVETATKVKASKLTLEEYLGIN